jgi:hypothetical protein
MLHTWYISTDRFVLYIRIISHNVVHKQNLNSRALNSQPTCISRYQSFINKTETSAVPTEDWGELLDLSIMVISPSVAFLEASCQIFRFIFYQSYICYMFRPPYANCQVYITHSTQPPLPRNVPCFMPRISSILIIMIQLQTTQPINIGNVNKSPPNHSLRPFHNNHPPKQNHSPYS